MAPGSSSLGQLSPQPRLKLNANTCSPWSDGGGPSVKNPIQNGDESVGGTSNLVVAGFSQATCKSARMVLKGARGGRKTPSYASIHLDEA
ncbi:hypothetical protein PanWU01x14_290080 [Parasponia andersonii]|uniref:Uncharacterized protein n=1 Tax=Parasponia andersonii TaxID=3476 RepID=A0A2P5AXX9_PARAD|nr:hypothetical protein PanWU01x14_290080 [Parasponia andersonii]